MMKTYIWPLPIRIFHGLFVLGLVLAFVFGETDSFYKFHVACGYLVGILLLYKLIY